MSADRLLEPPPINDTTPHGGHADPTTTAEAEGDIKRSAERSGERSAERSGERSGERIQSAESVFERVLGSREIELSVAEEDELVDHSEFGWCTRCIQRDSRLYYGLQKEKSCVLRFFALLLRSVGSLFTYAPTPTVNRLPGVNSCFSSLGAVLVLLLFLFYTAFSIRDYALRKNPRINTLNHFTDYETDSVQTQLQVVVSRDTVPVYNNSEYVYVHMHYTTTDRVPAGSATRVKKRTPLTLRNCSDPIVDGAMCPTLRGEEFRPVLRGIYASTRFYYVKMMLMMHNGVNASDLIVREWLDYVTVNIYLVTPGGYDGPFMTPNLDGVNRQYNMYAGPVKDINSNNVYTGLEAPQTQTYAYYDKTIVTTLNEPLTSLVTAYCRIGAQALEIDRDYESILDLFSALGGFLSILMAVGAAVFRTYNAIAFSTHIRYDLSMRWGTTKKVVFASEDITKRD